MIGLFSTFFQMKMRMNFNKTVHILQKIPYIGKGISDQWYQKQDMKVGLSVVWFVLFTVFDLLKKGLFFGVLYLVAILATNVWEEVIHSPEEVFMLLLVCNLLICGSVFQMFFINPVEQEDVITIKIFQVPPKKYYLTQFAYHYMFYLVLNILVLGVIFVLIDLSGVYALLLILSTVCIRFFATAVGIQLYRWGLHPQSEFLVWVKTFAVLLPWAGAAFIVFFHIPLSFGWLTHIGLLAMSLGLCAIGALGWKNGNEINRIASRSLSFETLKTHLETIENAEAAGAGVQMEETDYQEVKEKERVEDKEGIAYLNELFLQRTRHHIFRHIKRRALITAFVLIALLGFYAWTGFEGMGFSNTQNFIYTICFISFIAGNYSYYGESFSKFCFYNMDRKLMKYRFYRNPDIVMQSIKIRFIRSLKLNRPIFAIVGAGTIILAFLTEEVPVEAFLIILAFQFLVMVFFSINHLILYYLIQPYTESMKTKSPLYTIINFVFIGLFFRIMNTDTSQLPIIIPALAVGMILYLPIGLVAVYKVTPKKFKLR